MKHARFMEKLLKGVEVEWKALGEVGEFIRGNGMQKKDFVETGFPAIHYGQIFTRYGLSANKTFTYVSDELANTLRMADKNDLLIATTSENDKDVLKPVAWFGEQAAISGDMMLFRHDQNVKYLAYCFQTEAFQKQKVRYITGAKVRRVSRENLVKMTIPIPPLDIQTEIVRILDAFTALTAEITAEIAAELTTREKQYSYYGDQLLTFVEGAVEWKLLKEVAIIGTGSRNSNEAILGGKYPFFVLSQKPSSIDNFEFDETAIITTGDGVGVGKVFHHISGKYALHQRAYRIVVTDNNVDTKFLFHFIRNNFSLYLKTTAVHASVTSLRKPMFDNYSIPIPSLDDQGRIASTLDQLDMLTNSISEALSPPCGRIVDTPH